MNMPRTVLLAAALGLSLASSAGLAADKVKNLLPPQSSIAFINHGSIRDWQADKRQGVWIQDVRKNWHYAKLLGPCLGLDFALSVGFDTRPSDTLDRFGYIVVPGQDRCPIVSLSRSDPPAPKPKRGKAATEAAVSS